MKDTTVYKQYLFAGTDSDLTTHCFQCDIKENVPLSVNIHTQLILIQGRLSANKGVRCSTTECWGFPLGTSRQ